MNVSLMETARKGTHPGRRALGSAALAIALLAPLAAHAAALTDTSQGRPFGMAVDEQGNIYVADTWASVIRKIAATGEVTIVAGAPGNIGSADGPGAAARFFAPSGLARDAAGNLYVADTGNDVIRKISPSGEVSTLAGRAGTPGSADGVGVQARFEDPFDVATDRAGNLYVADSGNNTIRRISSSGAVTTLAGEAGVSGSNDGQGTAAHFFRPYGIATDTHGAVYVADTYNHTVRKITASGSVTTVAGNAGQHGLADGTGAHVRLYAPSDLVAGADGTVYVTDTGNAVLRRISPAGDVRTIAATAGQHFAVGITRDAAGNLYVGVPTQSIIVRISPHGDVRQIVVEDVRPPVRQVALR